MVLRVQRTRNGKWAVIEDGEIIARFDTNAKAWLWIDRNTTVGIEMEETRLRIGVAFTNKYHG